MKKIILAVAAMALAWNASAQVGIVAGVTSTATDIKSAWAEASDITQYHVGLAFKFSFADIFVIQPEVLYNVKGSKLSDGTDNTDFKADFKTGFLEVPLQLQLGIPIAETLRIYGFAEPFVGYAITNESKEELADAEEVKHNWDSVKNRLEYGVGAGVGVEILENIQLSVRYYWNLGKIYNDNKVPRTDQGGNSVINTVKQEKCSGIMASIGIFF